jgi:hypothetical protein
MLRDWGIKPDEKRRALRSLEKAGLIRIEKQGKRSPQLTLIVETTLRATDEGSRPVTAAVTPALRLVNPTQG